MLRRGACVLALLFAFHGGALAAEQQIIFRSIDTVAQVLELHNFGPEDQNLDSYRLLSSDDNETNESSDSNAFLGVFIEAGTSLFFHFLNDAPADPDHLNISSVGFFAEPLDDGPYAISFYSPDFSGLGAPMVEWLSWCLRSSP